MRRKTALIATSLTLLASVAIVPAASAQGGAGGGGGNGGGGNGGGGGRPARCTIVGVDPVTGSQIAVCTTARA